MSEVVGEVNGRLIIYGEAIFASGFNVYRPTEDPKVWRKENPELHLFLTYEAAAAWATKQEPLDTAP